jgi:hypothetical protein
MRPNEIATERIRFILSAISVLVVSRLSYSECYPKLVTCDLAMPVSGHGWITSPGSGTVQLRSGSTVFECGSSIAADTNFTSLDLGTSGTLDIFVTSFDDASW